MKLAFIGMGLMGQAMSSRLLDAGYELLIWNRTPSKCDEVKKQGAKHCESLAEVGQLADIIMLCISDTSSVEQVTHDLMPYLHEGQVIIDFSSISQDATKTLESCVKTKRCMWLDCPVSGGVAGAQAGSLAIMVGGDKTTLDKVLPILDTLGQRVTHMGPSGSGQTTKICNQMLVSCNVLVMAEVMALAKRAGVDASKIPQALGGGFADSIPLQITGPRMAEQDFNEIKWHVKTLLKDLDMANVLAKELGSAIPMTGLGAELMRQHGGRGYLDKDPATLVTLYEQDLSNGANQCD